MIPATRSMVGPGWFMGMQAREEGHRELYNLKKKYF